MTERQSFNTNGYNKLLGGNEELNNGNSTKNSRRDGILTIIGGMCIHLVHISSAFWSNY